MSVSAWTYPRHALRSTPCFAATRRARFEGAAGRLRPAPVKLRIARGADQLDAFHGRATRAIANRIAHGRARLDASAQLLSALSYTGILARGFAIVRDGNGAMVRRAADVTTGAALGIEFRDGEVRVQALEDGNGGRAPERPSVAAVRPVKLKAGPPGSSGGGSGGGQGTLF